MPKKLSKKQRDFVEEYLKTGNGTQAALKVYDTNDDNSASTIASENLQKLEIQRLLNNASEKAARRMEKLCVQEKNLPVAYNASKDILDRAGYKPKEEIHPTQIILNVIKVEAGKDRHTAQVHTETVPASSNGSN